LTPFRQARLAAQQLRERHCGQAAPTSLRSSDLIARIAAVDAEDFDITLARPDDSALSGADAVLICAFRHSDGQFSAAPSSWVCPGCRHFLYCPA
jgi:hypothetical protein